MIGSPGSPRILYLVPELIGKPGGIARYCKMVCEALGPHSELHVLSFFDEQSASPTGAETLRVNSYRAFGGKRLIFIAHTILALLKRPDVIILGHSFFATLGWCLAKMTGAPWVVFMYGNEVWFRHPVLRRAALRTCGRCFAISRYTAGRAVSVNGIPGESISILNNCLDPAFWPQPTDGNPELSLLTVSRLTTSDPYKGHALVLTILPRLCSTFPGLRYHIVGDGNGRVALQTRAQELGVSDVVQFHGIVTDEALRKEYRRAGVFVMPSSEEGFGFVFLEAMAQGTPAIGGNRDASPEVIEHGVSGYVVDPSDPEALFEAVCRVLADPEQRRAMGVAARQRAVSVFGFPSFQKKLRQEIDDVIAGRSATSPRSTATEL